MLLQQHRLDLAQEEFRQALAQEPDNAIVHAMLSLCLNQLAEGEEGLEEARQAVQLAPDMPFCHYVKACALDARGRYEEAHQAIAEAIRLDPHDADYFERQGLIFARQEKWEQALEASRQGLAIDAENVDCLNLQGMALTHLGRKEEARQAVEGSLARNPQNAFSHASMGWTLLHQSKHKEALEHFREALRLNPQLEYARSGMVEALKAKYLLYRLMLMYFLWMNRLSSRARWGVIIAIYLCVRFGDLPRPIFWILVAFGYLTWTAAPLFNLLLRLNEYGRYALSKRQVMGSNFVGAFLLGALVALGAGLWLDNWLFLSAAIILGIMVIPVAATFAFSSPKKRLVLGIYSGVLLAIGIASAVFLALSKIDEFGSACKAFFVGMFLFTILANVNFGQKK